MATKAPSKQSAEPIAEPKPDLCEIVDAALINLEDAIADELLDSLDWGKVRAAIIRKAPQKLFAWLVSGNDAPVNISQFPELAQLPSAENERAA